MSGKGSLWSLYNMEERHRVDDLPLSHLLIILSAIPPARLDDWVAWRPGAKDWQTLETYPELSETLETLRHLYEHTGPFPMDRPDQTPLYSETVSRQQESSTQINLEPDENENSSELELELNFDRDADRRTARRFKTDLLVEVKAGKNRFVSHTVDISMKGMRIRDALPEWVPLQFQATLYKEGHSINLLCRRVQRTTTQARIEAVQSPGALRQWLMKG